MNPEKFTLEAEVEEFELSYELDSSRENKDWYNFQNVTVIIDRSGKNFPDLPELMFGTYDEVPSPEMLSQPSSRREGVDMGYVAACIKKVAEDSGVHEFWFHPYGDDAKEERKETREAARQRLFSKYFDLEPGPNNYGYILKI